MTKQEAIEELKDACYITGCNYTDKTCAGCHVRIAIDAIRKQIKTDHGYDKRFNHVVCPVCNNFVYRGWKYCVQCGQALKEWKE